MVGQIEELPQSQFAKSTKNGGNKRLLANGKDAHQKQNVGNKLSYLL